MLSFNVDHLKYYLRNMPMIQVLRFLLRGGRWGRIVDGALKKVLKKMVPSLYL